MQRSKSHGGDLNGAGLSAEAFKAFEKDVRNTGKLSKSEEDILNKMRACNNMLEVRMHKKQMKEREKQRKIEEKRLKEEEKKMEKIRKEEEKQRLKTMKEREKSSKERKREEERVMKLRQKQEEKAMKEQEKLLRTNKKQHGTWHGGKQKPDRLSAKLWVDTMLEEKYKREANSQGKGANMSKSNTDLRLLDLETDNLGTLMRKRKAQAMNFSTPDLTTLGKAAEETESPTYLDLSPGSGAYRGFLESQTKSPTTPDYTFSTMPRSLPSHKRDFAKSGEYRVQLDSDSQAPPAPLALAPTPPSKTPAHRLDSGEYSKRLEGTKMVHITERLDSTTSVSSVFPPPPTPSQLPPPPPSPPAPPPPVESPVMDCEISFEDPPEDFLRGRQTEGQSVQQKLGGVPTPFASVDPKPYRAMSEQNLLNIDDSRPQMSAGQSVASIHISAQRGGGAKGHVSRPVGYSVSSVSSMPKPSLGSRQGSRQLDYTTSSVSSSSPRANSSVKGFVKDSSRGPHSPEIKLWRNSPASEVTLSDVSSTDAHNQSLDLSDGGSGFGSVSKGGGGLYGNMKPNSGINLKVPMMGVGRGSQSPNAPSPRAQGDGDRGVRKYKSLENLLTEGNANAQVIGKKPPARQEAPPAVRQQLKKNKKDKKEEKKRQKKAPPPPLNLSQQQRQQQYLHQKQQELRYHQHQQHLRQRQQQQQLGMRKAQSHEDLLGVGGSGQKRAMRPAQLSLSPGPQSAGPHGQHPSHFSTLPSRGAQMRKQKQAAAPAAKPQAVKPPPSYSTQTLPNRKAGGSRDITFPSSNSVTHSYQPAPGKSRGSADSEIDITMFEKKYGSLSRSPQGEVPPSPTSPWYTVDVYSDGPEGSAVT